MPKARPQPNGAIAQGIVDAQVVVAEITPANQNVFYELGAVRITGDNRPYHFFRPKREHWPKLSATFRCLLRLECVIACQKLLHIPVGDELDF